MSGINIPIKSMAPVVNLTSILLKIQHKIISKLILLNISIHLDTTAQPEHLQCPLVEMDSTTSLHTSSFRVVKLVTFMLNSMRKLFARLTLSNRR